MKIRIIIMSLIISLTMYNFAIVPKAQAWPTFDAVGAVLKGIGNFFGATSAIQDNVRWAYQLGEKIAKSSLKMAALIGTQLAVGTILGNDSQKAPFVSNWNQYLYLSPQQKTMAYLQSMFNTSTRGRSLTSNYEGIGQKYDQYLLRQAQYTINPKPMNVDIREYAKNPDNVFEGNSFRGLNAHNNCPNNPACMNLIAMSVYEQKFKEEQTVAKEKTTNGFLPKEKNGRIITPAALAQSIFLSLDQMGTNTIVQATDPMDVAVGVAVRLAGAGLQATLGSKESQAAAIQQNNRPIRFDFSYKNGQAGIGMNGVQQ